MAFSKNSCSLWSLGIPFCPNSSFRSNSQIVRSTSQLFNLISVWGWRSDKTSQMKGNNLIVNIRLFLPRHHGSRLTQAATLPAFDDHFCFHWIFCFLKLSKRIKERCRNFSAHLCFVGFVSVIKRAVNPPLCAVTLPVTRLLLFQFFCRTWILTLYFLICQGFSVI